MKEISVQELKDMMDHNVEFQLIDVREPFEYEVSNLNGVNIPLSGVVIESVANVSSTTYVAAESVEATMPQLSAGVCAEVCMLACIARQSMTAYSLIMYLWML